MNLELPVGSRDAERRYAERFMTSTFRLTVCNLLAVVAMAIGVGAGHPADAQYAPPPIYTVPIHQPQPSAAVDLHGAGIPPARSTSSSRGPLARLVRNDDISSGLPPYALADRTGRIQRYVEPIPSIDLEPFIGSVVSVRHDTGETLLASQLELPVMPMDVKSAAPRHGDLRHPSAAEHTDARVRRVEFLDNDSTIEILDDESSFSTTGQSANSPSTAPFSVESIEPIPAEMAPVSRVAPGEVWGEELPPGYGPMFVEAFPPEMIDVPMGYEVDQFGMGPRGRRSYYEQGMTFEDFGTSRGLIARVLNSPNCQLFAEVELILMRLHLTEDVVGKLSEQYKLSPRVIVGFEGGEVSDGRIRFWTYDHHTPLLEPGGGSVRFDFEVIDFEATQRYQIGRSDIVVGAGLRLAKINIRDVDGDAIGADMPGMTVAADARTHLCNFENGSFSWAYGARLSILGGDWGGSPDNDMIAVPVRDDNVVTNELRAGIEYAIRVRGIDWQARMAFEMQNWHSDVFARNANSDTISLLGPAFHIGAHF